MAENNRINNLNDLVQKAIDEKDDEKSETQSPDEIQAILNLDRLQLEQAKEEKEAESSGTDAIQEQAITILDKKVDGETAVLARLETEEAIATKSLDEFKASHPTLPPSLEMQGSALMQLLDERKKAKMAAEEALLEANQERKEMLLERDVAQRIAMTIMAARNFYKDNVLVSQMQEVEALDVGSAGGGED